VVEEDGPASGEPGVAGDPALESAVAAGHHLAGLIAATIALAKAEAREHLARLATLALLVVVGVLAGAAAAVVLAVSALAALIALMDSTALGLLVGALALGTIAALLILVAQRGFRRFKSFPASREELKRTLAAVEKTL
jgi:hypothetical protein